MPKKQTVAAKVENPRDKATLKGLVPFWDRLTVSIPEAAAAINVGVSTVYNMLDDGRLTGVKLGRRSTVTTASLRKLVHPAEAA